MSAVTALNRSEHLSPACQARPVHSHGHTLFEVDGEALIATEYSRGPWDPNACHGGPISALFVRTVERVDDTGPWQLARITVELLRPVPVLAPLRIAAVVERPGRMVSLVGATLTTADGTEVGRCRALRIRRADVALPEHVVAEPVFGEPGLGPIGAPSWSPDDIIGFHRHSVELRFAEGSFDTPGPVSVWGRALVPLFAGEEPSGAQRVMYAADFPNGVSSELDANEMLFINPDLTVHFARPPVGEWIGVVARSHYGSEGAGVAEGALYDQAGRLGLVAQSLLVGPR
jgi:hypothetical protein